MADHSENDIPPEFLTTEERKKKSEKDGGWQVVASRKPKKPEKDTGKGAAAGAGASKGVSGDGSSVFASLEDEAKQRRAKIEAKKAAEADAERDDTDDEEDELEFEGYGEKGKAGAGSEGEPKKEKKPKKPKVTVAEAAAKVSVEELSAFLAQINESFPNDVSVQLLRSADFFARAFTAVTPSLVNIPKISKEHSLLKALEVPLADIPEPIVSTTATWLQTKPSEELGKFLTLLISVAVEDLVPPGKSARGLPQPLAPQKAKVGMLVVLAILLRKKPDVLVQQAEAIRSNASFHTQERLPVLAWVYGQVAQVDLCLGLWLWSRNLLPLASGKQSSPISRDIILTFLESVLLKNVKKARSTLINGAVRKGDRLVPPTAFDLYLRLSFPAPEVRTKATERFAAQYQSIKDVALAGAYRGKSAKPAASQLFPLALQGLLQESTRAEASSVAVWCLAENDECYKQWEKQHLEDLEASTLLLEHLVGSWKQVKGQLEPLKDLRGLLKEIKAKHQRPDVANKSKSIAKAEALRRQLEGKLSWLPGCAKATATLVVAIAMGYGFYLLSPPKNPWGWDGYLLLSRTHGPLSWPDPSSIVE